MRKYVRKPSRLRYSRRTFRRSSAISRALRANAETKLRGVDPLDEAVPVPIQVGALVYKYTFCLGHNAPAAWTGYQPLGGFEYDQGAGNNERVGRYMYLDHTTINMSIHMNGDLRNRAPTNFRLILFKTRRATSPTGVAMDPDRSLFLNEFGSQLGPGQAGVNGNDLMLLPTNKRDWIIYKDKRFTLQAPMTTPSTETSSFQGKYPTFKKMRMVLPHKIKTAFNEATPPQPTDYDYYWGCAIFAAQVGRDEVAASWEVNLRGTTSAQDM